MSSRIAYPFGFRRRVLSFLFAGLLFPVAAQAQWGPEGQVLAQAYAMAPRSFSGPITVTAWSGVRTSGAKAPPRNLLKDFDLRLEGLRETLKVRTVTGPDDAPWMIYLTGVFDGLEDGRLKRALSDYSNLGYRVIAIPNPWSRQFIESVADRPPGSVEFEARVTLAAIDKTLEQFLATPPAKVHIVGESYGAFLAAMVAALDAGRPLPKIGGRVTLLGPPAHIDRAMPRLDKMIEDTSGVYHKSCSVGIGVILKALFTFGRKGLAGVLRNIGKSEREGDFSALSLKCSSSIVAWHGFQQHLVASADAYEDKHDNPGSDLPKGWKDSFLFKDFYAKFAPEELPADVEAPRFDLATWVAQTPGRVRILTAKDDFLNAPADWESAGYAKGIVIALPWGGHLGFQDVPAYLETFPDLFRP